MGNLIFVMIFFLSHLMELVLGMGLDAYPLQTQEGQGVEGREVLLNPKNQIPAMERIMYCKFKFLFQDVYFFKP